MTILTKMLIDYIRTTDASCRYSIKSIPQEKPRSYHRDLSPAP